ncbi:hypothetical protein HanPSC8_Chr08g0332101 [Helianthus annuus]|nr:hypothetical protein HanPSC8_Chr08g0332101 [Helianthus annuus]
MICAFTFESCHTIPAFLQSPNLISKFKSTAPFPFHSLSDFGSGSALSLPCVHHKPVLHGYSRHLLSDG